MSYPKRERGQYIREKILGYILWDLGKGVINAIQAGFVYDLISFLTVAGTTDHKDLMRNEYYKRAVLEWVNCRKARLERIRITRNM